ncbi:MAG TPA: hypothetical protein VFU17_09995 [Candidatus Limnocylindrales bacterium]|nr:hypothetical protein [Candidatus Limnocylindrales bacterium]
MARTVVDAGHLFVVERYLPDATLERLTRGVLIARRAARGADGPRGVRHRESIWIPSDETVLSTFIAASSEAVAEALRTAGIPADRIVEAVRFVPDNVRQAHSKEIDDA